MMYCEADECEFQQPNILPVSETEYEMAEDYAFCWQVSGRHYRIKRPSGTRHDGISAPQWTWSLFGVRRDGLMRAGASIHDPLYEYAGHLPDGWVQIVDFRGEWVDIDQRFSRLESDQLFDLINEKAGASKWRRRRAYFAVRVGGWYWWNKNRGSRVD